MAAPATGLLAIIPPPGVKGARIEIVYHSVWGFRASIPIPALSPRRLRRESAEPAREQAGPLHINPNRGGKPMALTLVIGNKRYSPWSLRPWLALRQAGIPFREIRLPLEGEVERAYVATVLAFRAIQAWLAASRSETEVLPRSELPEVAA